MNFSQNSVTTILISSVVYLIITLPITFMESVSEKNWENWFRFDRVTFCHDFGKIMMANLLVE